MVQKIPRLVEKIPGFGRKSTTPGTKNTKLWYEYQNAKNFILAQQKVQTQPQSGILDAKYFFNAYLQSCMYLIHSVLQSFAEEQKFVRGTDRGLHFCKETNKICKNAIILEFLAYLHFVAW